MYIIYSLYIVIFILCSFCRVFTIPKQLCMIQLNPRLYDCKVQVHVQSRLPKPQQTLKPVVTCYTVGHSTTLFSSVFSCFSEDLGIGCAIIERFIPYWVSKSHEFVTELCAYNAFVFLLLYWGLMGYTWI